MIARDLELSQDHLQLLAVNVMEQGRLGCSKVFSQFSNLATHAEVREESLKIIVILVKEQELCRKLNHYL